MNGFRVRKGEQSDYEKVIKIATEVWSTRTDEYLLERKYGSPVLDDATRGARFSAIIMDMLRQRPEGILVSEVEGEVVGFISFSLDEGAKIGEIGYNAVKEEYRGRGIGTGQLVKVLDIFKKRGMRYAIVYVWLDDQHAAARRMYEKCGFMPLVGHVTLARMLS